MDQGTYQATEALRDGSPVLVRAIRPEDKDRLMAFHGRLTPESVYLRYFEYKPVLSQRDLRYLTELDFRDRVALVATLGAQADAQLVGVARYDVLPAKPGRPLRAELGILVEDAHQGRGIGTVLLKHLLALAHQRGIAEITAEVLPQNTKMLELVAGSGVPVRQGVRNGVIHLRV